MRTVFATTLVVAVSAWSAPAAAGTALAPALSLDAERMGASVLLVVRDGPWDRTPEYPPGELSVPWPAEARAGSNGEGWRSASAIMLSQAGISVLAGAAGLGAGLAVAANCNGGPCRGAGMVLAGAGAGAIGYAMYAGVFGLIWLGIGKLADYRSGEAYYEYNERGEEYPYAPFRPAHEVSTSGWTIAGWVILIPGAALAVLGATLGFNAATSCSGNACSESGDIVAFIAGVGVTAVGTFTGLWGLTLVRIGNDRDAREYEQTYGVPPPGAEGPALPSPHGFAMRLSF